MTKRIKMEVDDGKGGKFTFSFSGSLDNTQLSKFNQIVDLVKDDPQTKAIELPEGNTIFGKVCSLIETDFPLGSFTSQDMLECYRAEYNDSIPLSTIATYLTRLYDRGMLNRERTRTGWSYRKLKPIDVLNE